MENHVVLVVRTDFISRTYTNHVESLKLGMGKKPRSRSGGFIEVSPPQFVFWFYEYSIRLLFRWCCLSQSAMRICEIFVPIFWFASPNMLERLQWSCKISLGWWWWCFTVYWTAMHRTRSMLVPENENELKQNAMAGCVELRVRLISIVTKTSWYINIKYIFNMYL